MRHCISGYRNAFPDLRVTVEEQVAHGNTVVTRWTTTGTHRGDLWGVPPTGKSFTITGVTIDRFVEGKIAESKESWDALGMLQQLGILPEGLGTQSRTATERPTDLPLDNRDARRCAQPGIPSGTRGQKPSNGAALVALQGHEDTGRVYGLGTSSTVWGIYDGSDITYLTSLCLTALGPTVMHEEAHHLGITSESTAEHIGWSGATVPMRSGRRRNGRGDVTRTLG